MLRVALLICVPLLSAACSHVAVKTVDNVDIIGRTMEVGGRGGELLHNQLSESGDPDQAPDYQVTVHPRGESWSRPICKRSEKFDVRRGFVSIDQKIPFTMSLFNVVTVDGMNEDGLTISGHTLRQSVYVGENKSRVSVDVARAKLCFFDLIPWVLGNFASVQDAIAALRNVSVVANTALPLPPGDRLHWAVEDASGDQAVLEYLDGELHVHQNKVGVFTNDPDYSWHLRNLNNYAGVPGSDPIVDVDFQTETDVGTVPSIIGHGFNLFGLPGDLSPASRFIKLFYTKALAMKHRGAPTTLSEGFKMVVGLLSEVWITKGVVALSKGDGHGQFEFTQYSLVKVPQKRLLHWRTYNNAQWHVANLTQLDFNKQSSTPLDDGFDGILDVTKRFLPKFSGEVMV